jgi:hypothetical protein
VQYTVPLLPVCTVVKSSQSLSEVLHHCSEETALIKVYLPVGLQFKMDFETPYITIVHC